MTYNPTSMSDILNSAEDSRLLVLPNFIEFGKSLHDRIHVQLIHQQYLQGPFTVFLILKDRRSKEKLESEFIYAGLDLQKKFLDESGVISCSAWDEMKSIKITANTLPITEDIMKQYEENTLTISIDSISPQRIAKQFPVQERATWSHTRELEYQILESYFEQDPATLHFVGLPVFQFGEIEGIAQIVFTDLDVSKDNDNQYFVTEWRPRIMRQIIKIFTREYEDLLWNWQLRSDGKYTAPLGQVMEFNKQKENLFANAEEVIKKKDKKILEELGYRKFYSLSKDYYSRRIEDHRENVNIFLRENRRRAAMAILVDSFAHNVSAHSLTVLKWIFQQRWEKVDIPQGTKRMVKEGLEGLISVTNRNDINTEDLKHSILTIQERWDSQERILLNGKILPVRDQIARLDEELTQLFRYLTEKGAFWNGIGREEQFGGEIRNLYDVLFEEFARNPLFLGTIAFSEGVDKINIKVHFYEKRIRSYVSGKNKKDALKRSYTTQRNDEGEELMGTLATIDLTPQGDKVYRYEFFQQGESHDVLKKALQEVEVYFPGGVVGRHAFFTLIENTLRDVKHYSEEERKRMNEEGLDLVIAIYPSKLSEKLRKEEGSYSLYKIGIYLACPQKLQAEKGPLGLVSLKNAERDILTSTQAARLGGSQQDKICAAMLLTGSLNRLVENDLQNDDLVKAYAPWLRFAHYYPSQQISTSMEEQNHFEYEFRAGKDETIEYENAIADLPVENGYLKKYIHLWRGEFVVDFSTQNNLLELNLGRYRMVNLRDIKHVIDIRKKGLVRFVHNKQETPNNDTAYRQWLDRWINGSYIRINIEVGNSTAGTLLVEKGQCVYYNYTAYRDGDMDKSRHATYKIVPFSFAHSQESSYQVAGERKLQLRNHGILKERFFPQVESIDNLSEGMIESVEKTYELAEILLTKIVIFDNRIAQRVDEDHRKYLKEQLSLDINHEMPTYWKRIKKEGFLNYNFLVFHIAFIKQIKNKEGKYYNEGKIIDFIESELMDGREIPDNFIFVVTSGRGRQQWWNQIEKGEGENLKRFTTFRPSESLINALENGVQMQDDFQVKYNLLKILFGS